MSHMHIVTGTLPSGETVKVERYLRGWEAYLKIVVDDVVWHDSQPDKKEMEQVCLLRERAMAIQSKKRDEKRLKVHFNAKLYLNSTGLDSAGE